MITCDLFSELQKFLVISVSVVIYSVAFFTAQAEDPSELEFVGLSAATSTPMKIQFSESAATSTPLILNEYTENFIHIGFDKPINFKTLEQYAKKYDIDIHGIYLYSDGLTMSHRVFDKEKNNSDVVKDAINTLRMRLARAIEMDIKKLKGYAIGFNSKNNIRNDHIKESIVVLNRQEQFLTVLNKFNKSSSLIYAISANRKNMVTDLSTDENTQKQLRKEILTKEELYSFKPKTPIAKQLYKKYNEYSSIAAISAINHNISQWEKRKEAKNE